jgi:polyphosphate glucokinase
MARAIGIDIGGSGVKAALVDTRAGQLIGERVRLETPQPSTPDAVADTVAEVVRALDVGPDEVQAAPVGITFPGVVRGDVVLSAHNMDPSWVGSDAAALFSGELGAGVVMRNDADAAGLAEAMFGAARGRPGVVLLLTFGTGIGSALLVDGVLVPNTELGHIEVGGVDAEERAAAAVRVAEDLSWKRWAERVSRYLQTLENLLWPELFIVGGGISRKFDKWGPLLECRTEVVPAALRNEAGIIGAASEAARLAAVGAVPGS